MNRAQLESVQIALLDFIKFTGTVQAEVIEASGVVLNVNEALIPSGKVALALVNQELRRLRS